jgi:hypothetical protein
MRGSRNEKKRRKEKQLESESGRIITFILDENYDRRPHGDGAQDWQRRI